MTAWTIRSGRWSKNPTFRVKNVHVEVLRWWSKKGKIVST